MPGATTYSPFHPKSKLTKSLKFKKSKRSQLGSKSITGTIGPGSYFLHHERPVNKNIPGGTMGSKSFITNMQISPGPGRYSVPESLTHGKCGIKYTKSHRPRVQKVI